MTARVWYSAEQPFLFPPLYIVERIARVHHWVILEEAQFDRDHIQFALRAGRNWVKVTPELIRPGRRPFNQHRLLTPRGFARRLATIAQTSYGKQAGYRQLKGSFEALLAEDG